MCPILVCVLSEQSAALCPLPSVSDHCMRVVGTVDRSISFALCVRSLYACCRNSRQLYILCLLCLILVCVLLEQSAVLYPLLYVSDPCVCVVGAVGSSISFALCVRSLYACCRNSRQLYVLCLLCLILVCVLLEQSAVLYPLLYVSDPCVCVVGAVGSSMSFAFCVRVVGTVGSSISFSLCVRSLCVCCGNSRQIYILSFMCPILVCVLWEQSAALYPLPSVSDHCMRVVGTVGSSMSFDFCV